MAVSTKPKNFTLVEIVFADATSPSPVTLTIVGAMDNLTLANLKSISNAVSWHTSRGKPTGKSYAAWEPITGSFGFEVRELSDAAVGAIPNWVQRTGAYGAAGVAPLVSTAGTGTEDVWSWNMRVKIKAATEKGDSGDHEFSVNNLHPTAFDYADGDPCSFTLGFEAESVTGDLSCLAVGV